MRELMVRPLGVYDKPNEYGQYPAGACKRAYNVHMRNPGEYSAWPARATFRNQTNADGYYTRKMWEDDAAQKILCATIKSDFSQAQWRWLTAAASSLSAQEPVTGTTFFPQAMKHRDRWFLVNESIVDVSQPATATTSRRSGLLPPNLLSTTSTTTTNAQCQPGKTAANWCACFVRTFADGYEIRSAPSWVMQGRNQGTVVYDPTITLSWGIGWDVQVGDKLELYRTTFLDITGSLAAPHDPGQDFFLAQTAVMDITAVTNRSVAIVDTCPDDGLGQDLYTNVGQTDNGANFAPGGCVDATTFKNFAMYVQRTVPQFLQYRIPGPLGFLSTDAERTHGIGLRVITATWTSGSAVLTGVSASHLKGIVAGQLVFSPSFAFTGGGQATVLSVNTGAGTITVDKTVSTAGTGTNAVQVVDAIGISGHVYGILYAASYADAANAVSLVSIDGLNLILTASSPMLDSREVTSAFDGFEFIFAQANSASVAFSMTATNGQNYSPPLPAIGGSATSSATITSLNIVKISKLGQPEHIDPESEITVGSGTVYRIWPTQDSVLAFCSDGLWRIAGYGPGTWRSDLLDPTILIAGPNCVDSLFETIYVYCNRGLVALGSAQQSTDITVKRLNVFNTAFHGSSTADAVGISGHDLSVTCNPNTREVFVRGMGDPAVLETYCYNESQNGFTTVNANINHASLGNINAVQALVYASWPGMQTMIMALKSAHTGSAQTDLDYYDEAATTAETGQVFTFRPVMGASDDPTNLMNWIDATCIFDGLVSTGPAMLAQWNTFTATLSKTVAAGQFPDVRATFPTPSQMMLSPTMAFGLSMASNTRRYNFKGVSLRFVPAGEESTR